IGLLLTGGTWGALVRIVTAFTIGHSITLSLAALNVVTPPATIIEPAIRSDGPAPDWRRLGSARPDRHRLHHRPQHPPVAGGAQRGDAAGDDHRAGDPLGWAGSRLAAPGERSSGSSPPSPSATASPCRWRRSTW